MSIPIEPARPPIFFAKIRKKKRNAKENPAFLLHFSRSAYVQLSPHQADLSPVRPIRHRAVVPVGERIALCYEILFHVLGVTSVNFAQASYRSADIMRA